MWYIFQGINTTKALDRVLGIRCMRINSFNAEIDKAHLSRYKYLKKYKSSKNNVLNDQLHKVHSSIAGIVDKSSKVIENTIRRNSGSRSISNHSETS